MFQIIMRVLCSEGAIWVNYQNGSKTYFNTYKEAKNAIAELGLDTDCYQIGIN